MNIATLSLSYPCPAFSPPFFFSPSELLQNSLHFASEGKSQGLRSYAYHVYRLNDRCSLVAKNILDLTDLSSMVRPTAIPLLRAALY